MLRVPSTAAPFGDIQWQGPALRRAWALLSPRPTTVMLVGDMRYALQRIGRFQYTVGCLCPTVRCLWGTCGTHWTAEERSQPQESGI